ncbi:MAG: RnfABCDGE type electron transport complex subunit D [Candidatus Saganbacteria bacterium]|nr:RnfABCDGE type electron transport complex subunit D [Candidatus Saganbacteria bacterium]
MSFLITSSPHSNDFGSVPLMMRTVIIGLLPATIAGIVLFGWPALLVILSSVIAAVLTELAVNKIMKVEPTISDGSAALTGLLLALTLSPVMPWWQAALGAVFAIAVGKMLFGGLGYNIFNPALVGRAFLAAAFPVQMTTWAAPMFWRGVEAVSSATPLALMKFQQQTTVYSKLFFGNVSGCIGETSALLLLLPALFFMFKGLINWRIPASYLGSVAVLGGLFWLIDPTKYPDPLFHLLAGGLMLGALYMATDLVTSPLTPKGMWVFGAAAGVLVVVIRLFSGLPEGVMYSILIMNAFVPLINCYTRPRILGYPQKRFGRPVK